MSETPLPDDPEAARRAAAAKQRFFAIGLFRLSGVVILMFGIAISLERFGWVQGDKAKYLGLIVSTVGMFQTIFVPRLLARAWATPRERR
ncbi:MAG TPA: hypothetical protein VFF89_03620 [Sphingobium sp.]|nr:hypothetical protein [Sphingobium sp.]